MKLSLKLPLAFILALGLLLLGGLFGIFKLSSALNVYENEVKLAGEAHAKVAEINGDFARSIQEWKNVLLRGKEPKDLEKYWKAHGVEMQEAQNDIKACVGVSSFSVQ